MATRRTERAPTVNERIRDRTIGHSVLLERAKRGEASNAASEIDRILVRELRRRLYGRLRRLRSRGVDSGPWTTQLYRDTLKAAERVAANAWEEYRPEFATMLGQTASTEAEWMVGVVRDASPIDLRLALPTATTLRASYLNRPIEGKFLADWFADETADTARRFTETINTGLAQGQSMRQMQSAFRRQVEIKARHAETMVRTAVTHTSSSARRLVAAENEDVIRDRWQFLATLDTRTSDTCKALDGRTFEHDEGPYPPVHPNCRSTVLILTKSIDEILGTKGAQDAPPAARASMNGRVPPGTTYPEWLRSQPAAVQDMALGRTRARLFRSGEVEIDSFVAADYSPLRIDEILEREGITLSEIGN